MLEARHAELNRQASNLARAIARNVESEALTSELANVESEIKDVKRRLSLLSKSAKIGRETLSFEEFRKFVIQKAGNLESALRSDLW